MGFLDWIRFLKDTIRRIFNRCKTEFQLRPLFPFLSGSHRHSWIRMHSGRGLIEMGETSSESWTFVIFQCHSLFHPKCVSIPAWQVASIQATFKCKVMSSSSLMTNTISYYFQIFKFRCAEMRWSGRREGRSDQPRLKKRQFQVFQDFTNSTHLHCLNSRHQKVLEDIVTCCL